MHGGRGRRVEECGLLGMLAKPVDGARVDVVHRTDHTELVLLHEATHRLAVRKRRCDRLEHILAHCERNDVLVGDARMRMARALDGGNDVVDERGDAAVDDRTRCDGVHGAALRMAEHDQDGRLEVPGAVLDRADLIDVGDIACDADDEDVADALVEHALKRHARVGAAEDRDHRRLAGAGLDDAGDPGVRVLRGSRDKSRVARLEFGDDFIGGADRRACGRARREARRGDSQVDEQAVMQRHGGGSVWICRRASPRWRLRDRRVIVRCGARRDAQAQFERRSTRRRRD